MSKASTGSLTAHLSDFFLNSKALRALARRFRARRDSRAVSRLDDYMLKDIGLTRTDIFAATHGRMHHRD